MSYALHLGKVELITIEADRQHPNRMKFKGILVILDTPSTKPPNGAQGHRILVSTEVAKRRLGTLIGMGLNYAPDLDAHAQRRKVGVIDKAWIDGKDLKVEGHIWKHDFPEAEKDLKKPDLGMSMELGDVRVDNPKADVWTLDDFQFLGATILWRDSAAYNKTQAIAARAEQRSTSMDKSKSKTKVAAHSSQEELAKIAAEAAAGAVKKGTQKVLEVLEANTKVLASITAAQEELSGRIEALETGSIAAAGDAGSSSSTATEDEMESARSKKASSTSSSTATEDADDGADDSEDDGDEDEVESAMDEGDLDKSSGVVDDNAGHANEDEANRGEDGAGDLAKKVGKTVESAQVKALRTANKALRSQLAASEARITKITRRFEDKLDRVQKQVSAATERASRKSFSPEVMGLLAKANIDPQDLIRTGTKMTVAEVDGLFAGVQLKPEDRMTIKNNLLAAGVMDVGQVTRNVQ